MFEDFNELFNYYFNKNKKSSFNTLFDEMFLKLNKSYLLNENNKEIENDFGPPDKVLNITENGVSFTKSIWYTPLGHIVKVELTGGKQNEISLEKKLKLAIDSENYEEAAKIRDEIKLKKKSKNEKN